MAMSDEQSTSIPQEAVLVEIALVPIDGEDRDFETLSAVEDVTASVLKETATIYVYTSKIESDGRRSTGVILLLNEIAHQVMAQKDLIVALLEAGAAALTVLGKQRRVSKIELSLDGDSISIENPDTATAQGLLALFEAKHPGIAANVTPSSKLHVTGKVSKKGHLASK